jgi:hypothetical protein
MKDNINKNTPQPLYTNKHGNIYEGDIVECFDIVAVQITIIKGVRLTKKVIGNARVVKSSQNET